MARLRDRARRSGARPRQRVRHARRAASAAIDWRAAAEVAKGAARLRLPLLHRRASTGCRLRRRVATTPAATRRHRCSRPRPPTAPPAPRVASRCSRACSPPRGTGGSPSRPTSTTSRCSCSRGCRCTPGADWHERECWEMFGFVFDGHPALRHLYLPSEFEGHPLRKDYPLLSRVVKPWPGLVDVEPMPGEGDDAEAAREPRRRARRHEHHQPAAARVRHRPARVPAPRRRAGGRRARHRRHDPQPRVRSTRPPTARCDSSCASTASA